MSERQLHGIVGGAAAVLVVGAIAVTVTLLAGARTRTQPTGHVVSSLLPGTHAPGDLARLTRQAPCPPPTRADGASRRQLGSFDAVVAVTCTYDDRTFAGAGEWTVLVRKASSTGIDQLVRVLDTPDLPLTSGPCVDVLIGSPPLALVDRSGRYLIPRFPRDECGQPQRAAIKAVGDVPWQTISVRKVKQQATAKAVAAGCTMQVKNMIYIDARLGADASAGGPVFTHHPDATLRACIYRTPASDPQVGTFQRGVTLDAADSAALRRALTGAGTSETCKAQRDFAVVSTRSGDQVFVELGGCWRVQRDETHVTLGTADALVVTELLGLR